MTRFVQTQNQDRNNFAKKCVGGMRKKGNNHLRYNEELDRKSQVKQTKIRFVQAHNKDRFFFAKIGWGDGGIEEKGNNQGVSVCFPLLFSSMYARFAYVKKVVIP